jgi:hypothetical protein
LGREIAFQICNAISGGWADEVLQMFICNIAVLEREALKIKFASSNCRYASYEPV